jgi:hypothetical protein
VIQPDLRAAIGVPGADFEQPEVVVVRRVRRAQERRLAGNLQPHLETEDLGVELDLTPQPVDVQDGVVQTADWHRGLLDSWTSLALLPDN